MLSKRDLRMLVRRFIVKTLGFCPAGSSDDDLRAGLEAFRRWGASAIVTALDHAELGRLRLAKLGECAEALGMDWYHVPIPDGCVPEGVSEVRYRYASMRVRRSLSRGGAVVVSLPRLPRSDGHARGASSR